jgi:RND family efflux transporter MFP subunit
MKAKTFHTTCLLASLHALVFASGCQGQSNVQPQSSSADSASASDSQEPPARVAVIKPQRKLLERRCEQPGEIAAFEETPLYAKVAGYVQTVNVDIGDKIKQGQTLAVLTVPELVEELKQKAALVVQAQSQITQANAAVDVAQAVVETAEAKVAAAEAAIARTTADVNRWKSEFARVNELADRSAVTRKVADETLDQLRVAEGAKLEANAQVKSCQATVRETQAKLSVAKADVEAANARLTVAQADHDRTKALTEYATIKAPYDGTVNQRLIHTGHYVQPATTGRDQPLLVVLHSDMVRVVVNVPEGDAGFTKIGEPATIRVQSLENKQFSGSVKRVASALDTTTRTLRAEIELENSSGELVPGMYCYVSIQVGKRPDALVIPTTAVLVDQGKSFCLVVANGRIVRTPIEIGLRTGSEVEVVTGLNRTEAVIPKNPASLKEGQRVDIIN